MHGFRRRMQWWRCRGSRSAHWSASGAFQGQVLGCTTEIQSFIESVDGEKIKGSIHNTQESLFGRNPKRLILYPRLLILCHHIIFFLRQAVYLLKMKKGCVSSKASCKTMKVTIEETQTLVYSLYVLHYFINLVSNWAWSKCGNVCEAIPPMLLAVNQPWLIPPYNQGGGNRALCILPQTNKERVHTWDDDGPSSNQSCSTSSGGGDLTAIKPGDSCNWRRRMNFFTSSPPPAFMCLACIALHCIAPPPACNLPALHTIVRHLCNPRPKNINFFELQVAQPKNINFVDPQGRVPLLFCPRRLQKQGAKKNDVGKQKKCPAMGSIRTLCMPLSV